MTGIGLAPPLLIAALLSLALTTRITFVGGQRPRDSQDSPSDSAAPLQRANHDDYGTGQLPRAA